MTSSGTFKLLRHFIWILWEFLAQRENEDESEDEIVNVDEPDEMETEATDAQRLVSELAVQSCEFSPKLVFTNFVLAPEKVPPVVDINDVVRANTSPSPPPRQRRSPKGESLQKLGKKIYEKIIGKNHRKNIWKITWKII